MDFETLIWLAVIAFWIFGLGRGKKSAKRRPGVPGQTSDPPSVPRETSPQPVAEAPASLEEALRQIREALGETSAPAAQPAPPPSKPASSPSLAASTGTFHSTSRPAPQDPVRPRTPRMPERPPRRSTPRPAASGGAGSEFRSPSPSTLDDAFRDKPSFSQRDFLNLEESPGRRSALVAIDIGAPIPLMEDTQTYRDETQAEASIRSGSTEELRQAIIWSEILGHPKSRRRPH